MYYDFIETPIGQLLVVVDGDGALVQLDLPAASRPTQINDAWKRDLKQLTKVRQQIDAYFAGGLTEFDLALRPHGTDFQLSVWDELTRIPYGETISYVELARRIGKPKASRAVGAANGANPLALIVPCHRVIGANGTLTGYGGGLPTKRYLLDHERRHMPQPTLQLRA